LISGETRAELLAEVWNCANLSIGIQFRTMRNAALDVAGGLK
jgi:hypothetical protein